MKNDSLVSSSELAKKYHPSFDPELVTYHEARRALLKEEIEVRRHLSRLAESRRNLPPGPRVLDDYEFDGPGGKVRFKELFGDKDTLVIYSYMFGPERKAPCPMCTSFMRSWSEKMPDIQQRLSLIFVARSPIEKLYRDASERGLSKLPLYADTTGNYTRAFVDPGDGDIPALNIFQLKDNEVRLFWREEMSPEMADPGQDPRGSVDIDPLWNLLDLTPRGRGDWYPKLRY